MGWNVIPFSMRHPSNIETEWSEYFVDEIEYGSDYSLWEKILRIPKVVYSFEARQNVRKLLNKNRVDICHAHNIYHHISPSILSVIKKYKIPVVMTLHDLKIACPAYNMLASDGVCERCKNGRIHNVILHRCIKESIALSSVVFLEALVHKALRTFEKYVDHFVVPSHFYINKFVEWGFPREKFVYIPNFVELSNYQPNYNVGSSLLYFGRLSKEKGLETLIRACSIVNIPLQIAGTGPQELLLRQLSERLGADVKFLGHLSGHVLHGAIRAARAVILPSQWYENAPISIIEAYALGKPIIGADIGGIAELIRPGETGLIFKSGSIEALVDALKAVGQLEAQDISRMGKNGRAWVESEFSQQNYQEKISRLYQALGVS